MGNYTDNSAQTTLQPRQVLVFSGHMVDAPDRPVPRFPLDKIAIVAEEISHVLDDLGVNHDDLALTQGAGGSDLIFAGQCQSRNVTLQFLQPFPEPEFIVRSVLTSQGNWLDRYNAIRKKMDQPVLCMPEHIFEGENPFEACNLWLLNTALAYGPEKVRFICLWNGESGDGAGGTAHMVEQVKKSAGAVVWLDTRKLWQL